MKNRQDKAKIACLKKVYALYDEAIEHVDVVCRPKCSSCCTCNVTLTRLETDLLMTAPTGQETLKRLLSQNFPEKRYIPAMTQNRFARMCAQGLDIPEEENDPSWGRCPLLADDMCSVYAVRPFGCRALVSQVNCSHKGYAQVPPFVLTLNTLFSQAIEQLDHNGFSGNLTDMLALFLSGRAMEKGKDDKFCLNEKISVLMVPPEHREKVRPLLDRLSDLSQENGEKSHGESA